MSYQATEAEIKRAELPHSILLFDLIVVHVFLFVIGLGMIKSSYIPLMLMPITSIALLGYVLLKARNVSSEPSWFVRCHLMLAAKRARLFLLLFLVTGSFTAFMYFGGAQIGLSKIASYSLAFGIGQLPFMVALLALVVLEYDASHQCKSGKIPAAAIALHPAQNEA
ncbi:MAG TPA: hypothetical protein VFW53_02500 [Gallionella sp.]|nr:hypothetical protein [Gallionella sp.]